MSWAVPFKQRSNSFQGLRQLPDNSQDKSPLRCQNLNLKLLDCPRGTTGREKTIQISEFNICLYCDSLKIQHCCTYNFLILNKSNLRTNRWNQIVTTSRDFTIETIFFSSQFREINHSRRQNPTFDAKQPKTPKCDQIDNCSFSYCLHGAKT